MPLAIFIGLLQLTKVFSGPVGDLLKQPGNIPAFFPDDGQTIGGIVVRQQHALAVPDHAPRGIQGFNAGDVVPGPLLQFLALVDLKVPEAEDNERKQDQDRRL